MTDHLSATTLSALADGELAAEQLETTNQHLAECPSCTSNALQSSLLKSAMGKTGQRFAPTHEFQARVARQIKGGLPLQEVSRLVDSRSSNRGSLLYSWTAAAAVLFVSIGIILVQHNWNRSATASVEFAALATEACDQHIATLASNASPEVISSDRHTVKPWFQGKLPFSFNLPDNLPNGTILDGANLTYIHGLPAAQLLYSIGKHRVSVYLEQATGDGLPRNSKSSDLSIDHSGFHVFSFKTSDLDGIAVSDVDPARLSDLATMIARAQN
ncbi:MAG: zf-HC2 domain-containing protein [Terracidiphilus sp.]|jgi:anti-sigma factor RsiW